ncbi:MAG: hypothetical protein AAF629_23810 [Chloroflexota bacterium]
MKISRRVLSLGILTLFATSVVSLAVFAIPVKAQPEAGFVYITQVNDTLASLAEKYLGDPDLSALIIQRTKAYFGVDLPEPLTPGLILFIPDGAKVAPTATQPPVVLPTATPLPPKGPPPSGKIAFSFYNRALARRVWEINLINADGSGRQVIRWNQVGEPALSPDGTHLAFRGWSGFGFDTGRVLSVGPISAERHWPTGSFQEDSRPDWSHDGSRLVFSSQRESDRLWRLYFIHADGQHERPLARADGMPLFGEDPAWASDDYRIIYRGCAPNGGECGLWFITLDGVVSAPIIQDSQAIQPDGSPIEDRVVFASSQSGNWEIYTVNIDGTGLLQLTDHPAIDGMPTWSPDGEWIAFQSTRPSQNDGVENWGIWLIREDGSDLHQIFAFDGGLMQAHRFDLPYGSRDWYDEQISWGR